MSTDIVTPIRQSFTLIEPNAEQLVNRFYNRLFSDNPGLRPMFPKDMAEQKKMLLGAIALVVSNIDNFDRIEGALETMGARHVSYGAQEAHYPVVRDTLLAAMQDIAGEAWNQTFHDAWEAGLNVVAEVMIRGARTGQTKAA